jgi:PKD repeat protein
MTPAVAGAEAPAVNSITPYSGVNNSLVSITNLAGTNFINGATVMLTPVTVNPTHKGSLSNGGSALLSNPRGVYISGIYTYVASTGSNALEIIDVTNPAAPSHKGSLSNGGSALLSNPRGVYISGNYAYVASTGSNALEIVDVTNPAAPSHKGSLSNGVGGALLASPYNVYVSGNYAYVASYGSNALEIVDVTNPAAPSHTGSFSISTPSSVKVSGTYAYVTSTVGDALWIIDVTNPAVPVAEGSITITAPSSVYISGNYAYVANTDYSGGALDIVNITNPAVPVHTGSIANNEGGARFSSPESVYVSGNYAYVVSPVINRLEIVDVTNPAAPVHSGSISNGGSALLLYPRSVFVVNNYAYVASFTSNALEIVDLGTVTATGVNVVSANRITCSFNLNNNLAGLYNVVVTNPDGNFGTRSSGFTIFAAGAPVASFTGTPISGVAPLTVTFTDRSTQVPTSWNWSFGDGNFSNDQNPVHTYNRGGAFTVSLSATNSKGTSALTRSDYIVVNGDKMGVFRNSTGNWYLDYNNNGVVDKNFRFGITGDNPVVGDWDGNELTDVGVYRPSTGTWYLETVKQGIVYKTFRFGITGDYPVVGDWDGNELTDVGVYRPSTGTWYLETAKQGIVNKTFRFGITGDIPVVGDWDGNGITDVGVYRPSTGTWYLETAKQGIVYKTFRFGITGDIPVVGDWDGNGITDVGVYRPSTGTWYLNYYKNGAVNKVLRFGIAGDSPKAGMWITQDPVAAFTNTTPRIGTVPLTVRFTDYSSGTVPLSYSWDFGDGNESTTRSPSHVYSSIGTYTVTLTVTNGVGSDTEEKTDYITVNSLPEAPVADFSGTPRSGAAPLTVSFTDASTGSITSQSWQYKNTTVDWTQFSTVESPSYAFPVGTYDIRLNVTGPGGSDTWTETGYITANEV